MKSFNDVCRVFFGVSHSVLLTTFGRPADNSLILSSGGCVVYVDLLHAYISVRTVFTIHCQAIALNVFFRRRTFRFKEFIHRPARYEFDVVWADYKQ